ncbi:hypothetical protein BY458DRAFT_450834 [Sporodiniella umbellata]|nr:hypothetical protein BY458DRAFT_450834 [Sporodiniella umbellata]
MNFLKKSDIPYNILSQFWDAVDSDRKGFLTEQEFCTILKLIACAQHGVVTGEPILTTTVPLPQFNGEGVASTRLVTARNNNTDLISTEDRSKYINLFHSLGPEDGILNGQTARDIFVRSGLPPAKLQVIWDLANTRKSNALNQTEFIVAMHYIERTMKESAVLPPTLPASIYASAIGRGISSPLTRNNTIQTNRVPIKSPVFKGSTLANIEITSEEYVKYKAFFDQLSTNNSGYVSGADAVVFFKHSKLPESDLARIWDLADTNSTGQLTEQEFAKAMHMINMRLAGNDVPSSLPAFRTQTEQTKQQEPIVDLLGIVSEFDSTFAPPQAPHTSSSQQQYTDLSLTQSALQTNIENEISRTHQKQAEAQAERKSIEELQRQIQQQKEQLEQAKNLADEAERQLEEEKRKKERLMEELQIYKQETKHFKDRAENARNEALHTKQEIKDMEKEKSQPSITQNSVPKSTSQDDVFALTSSGGLFAKVHDESSHISSPESVHSVPAQKTYDPFAGFKANQTRSLASSPVFSLNKLKESTDSKRLSSTVDISEIETKFPDLNTVEQSYTATNSSLLPSSSKQPIPKTSHEEKQPTKKERVEEKPKNKSVEKYGFDLSAFESPSVTNNDNLFTLSAKDELSSIFGSESAKKPTAVSDEFDSIFTNPTKGNTGSTSFEDTFFKK